ncbi:exodeoxyribonuclease VII large subunit [Massilibacteroides sp.]|uniref:exodeoxyribonuclease VII large subunit n=1 Tax=Massilibacteroides sp. TaxID=2034766 RepID=UPI00262DEBB0|nr:exodeoxyribonuclease VII large subunit [Massilibacteroides sp.]MDD4514431.1 exodeoxyribonuclease VII large subunit [Massilibacteroides sp.]
MIPFPDNRADERKALTLRELNLRIKSVIQDGFPDYYWLRAETSDVRVNHSSGHCYLEFIEKHPQTGQLLAKSRASIWAKTFALLKPYFEKETGQAFVSGLTVLVKVSVEFHELYGFSLTVYDIDPTYTLGDMARKRMEILNRLKTEGILTLNKELLFPSLPQRIAVITSPTAAGYEDFMNQLMNNEAGYPFYVKLFPALMQGDKTEESVISALDRIYSFADHFDVVVIIRGGGATSDLNSFDSYLLAANCAQFPLPIITGIGHERDETVLDMVAHTRTKTPTAVAEFLIGCMDDEAENLALLQDRLVALADMRLMEEKTFIQLLVSKLPILTMSSLEKAHSLVQVLGRKLPVGTVSLLAEQRAFVNDRYRDIQRLTNKRSNEEKGVINELYRDIQEVTKRRITEQRNLLQMTEQFVQMGSPDYILKRGYTLTLKDGTIQKSASSFVEGECYITRFSDGDVDGIVTKMHKK